MVGLDVDADRVKRLASGESFVEDIPADRLGGALASGRYLPSTEYADAEGFDICVITVPTPLRDGRARPQLRRAGRHRRSARTSGPGARWCWSRPPIRAPPRTCSGRCWRTASGLRSRGDFHLGYSPERIDPGNPTWRLENTPKVVSGVDAASLARVRRLLRSGWSTRTVPVDSHPGRRADQADREHLPARQHRAGQRAGDVRPPARHRRLGGHRRRLDQAVRVHARSRPGRASAGTACRSTRATCPGRSSARWAGRSGSSSWPTTSTTRCPSYVAQRVMAGLNRRGRPVNGARLLLLGLAYKKNTGDMRDSPARGRGPSGCRRSARTCTRWSRTRSRSTSRAGWRSST